MEIIYLSLHCHHQNDFCMKVGSEEIHKAYQGRREEGIWRKGKRETIYTYCYTVTTRMTLALRWVAMSAILMFH